MPAAMRPLAMCRGYLLMSAAAAVQMASSCDPVPLEQPIAPTILPSSISGMPPREATTSSRLRTYLQVGLLYRVFESLGRTAILDRGTRLVLCNGNRPEQRAVHTQKATRLAPESTTAMSIGQPFLFASATAAWINDCARSAPIAAP